ncbi:MAG: Ig-like domain repeat protein [Agathobacter sp.]|uniref:Ig-like domain repeat protein n=1 Tax=Agathobacter sp. TaxID=2021311 RepID=UPI003996001E
MKRRVKSFLLAILMVFTILPTNFNIIGAENRDVKIVVYNDKNELFEEDQLAITITDGKEKVKNENINCRYDDDYKKALIDVRDLEETTPYTLKISYDGYLEYETTFIPQKIKDDMDVTLIKDPFSTYDFSNMPSALELRQSGLTIETCMVPQKPDGFSEDISSSNTDVADIKDGVLNLKSAGNTTITACLSKELKKPDGTSNGKVYKLVSKDVTVKKNSHNLVVKSGTPDAEIYTKQDGTVTYASDDPDYDGTITYSFDDANSADLADKPEGFETSGQWKAKDTYGEVTVKVVAPATDKYEGVETSYTTKIVPYDYSDYSHYWTIDGDTFKNEGRIYTKISGIVPSKDNKDGNRYVIKLKDNAGSEWSSDGISAEDLCLKQGHNDINVTIGKGVFDGDKITDVEETGDAVISFEYDSENPKINSFDFADGSRPNENGWNKGEVTVNIAADDEGSGISAIKYQLFDADGKVLVDNEEINYANDYDKSKGTIKIPDTFQGDGFRLSATAYDNTGHSVTTETPITIKNDTEAGKTKVSLAEKIRFFNKDVVVNISAADSLSGLQSVKYAVVQGEETPKWDDAVEIFAGSSEKPGAESFEKTITVNKGIGFTKKINVYVMVTDMAGNVDTNCLSEDHRFTIDTDAPEVNVAFYDRDDLGNDTAPVTSTGTTDYYNRAKTVQIAVDDANFDPEKVKIFVSRDGGKETDITKKDKKLDGVTIGEWDNDSIDVSFDFGHTYYIYAIAEDKAGNANTVSDIKVNGGRSLTFLLDNEIPSGNFSLKGYKKSGESVFFGRWEDWALTEGKLSYTVYSNMITYIEGSAGDPLSGVKYAGYIYSDTVLSDTELASADRKWNELETGDDGTFKSQIPAEDRKFIIYVKITDNCDNTRYISSDGVVYDETVPVVENVSISDETKPNDDMWNRSDVKINVSAFDNLSGIKKIRYTVTCGTKTLKEDECVLTLNDGNSCDVSGDFIIQAGEDNANDGSLTVNVTAEDMSGNLSETRSIPVNLDTKAPDGKVEDTSEAEWITEDKTYKVTAYDGTSGIRRITYSVKNSDDDELLAENEEIVYDEGFAAGKSSAAGKIVLPAEDHRFDCSDLVITVCITDMADNTTEIVKNTSIDTTEPDADIETETEANDAGWYNDDITFKTTAYDATSGIESVTYTITAPDGTIIGGADRPVELKDFKKGNKNVQGTIVIKKSDSPMYDCGALAVTTTTQDAAGNIRTASKTIKVDTTKPDAELTGDSSENKDGWHNQKVVFTLDVSDAGSGIKNAVYTITDGSGSVIGKEDHAVSFEGFKEGVMSATGKIEIPMVEDHLYDYKDLTLKVLVYDIAGNVNQINSKVNVDTTKPDAGVSLNKKTKEGKTNNYFNKDVDVDITASDSLSGVKSISYKIVTGETDAYGWKEIFPEGKDKAGTNDKINKTITVPKDLINDDWIDVYVKVTDEADNETLVHLDNDNKFRINTKEPVVYVSYGTESVPDPEAYSIVGGTEYYNAQRSATVTVKEYDTFFDPDKVQILVSEDGKEAVDVTKNTADGVSVGGWSTLGTGRDAEFSIPVFFKNDHKYRIEVKAEDLSDNTDNGFTIADKKSDCFIIDTVNPFGDIKYNGLSAGEDTVWKEAVTNKKYEISRFSKGKLTVSGKVGDSFSKVKSISYHVTENDGALTDMAGISSWKEITGVKSDGSYSVSIEKTDKNYTVYLKITDYSGNTSYISTNGAVTDTQMPKISVKIPDSDTGIYTSDVPVNISVSDDVQGGVSSGIKSVTYRVAELGETTQEGSLYEYTGTAKSISGLKKELSTGIVVNTAFNNSNDVQIQVTATDNAGNVYSTTNTLKIDITSPQIEVSYDNNDGDTSFGDGAYFKEARTATIKVTERNFDETKVLPVITSSEGGIPSLSGWSTSYGTGNGDDITHYATIYYGSDADYTFDVSMTDAAGNRNDGVSYGNSTAPDKFTIDKTIPVIAVTYDNNNAQNENYFKETRTATVTITEHNFESSRMQLTMSAADNGNAVETASISGWSDSGDTHTATITFAKDAVYTWAMSYTDKAGNKAEDLSNQNFCIDLTKPSVSISGITPGSANSSQGNIGFAVECMDTNFDTFTPVLSAVVYENGKFVKKTVEGNVTSIGNGQRVEYGNLEEDGMYSFTCSAADKAGNVYDTVNITDAQGNAKTLNLQAGDDLMDFSVNRNGSVFALDDYSIGVVNDHYIQEQTQDIVLVETNADPLVNYSILLNGTQLNEGTDYTVARSGQDESWNRYEYHIDRDLFEDEGEYNIVAQSEDKASSVAYSDLKNVNVDFIIDKTAPVFTVSGIEDGGNYRGTSRDVTLMPKDDGGKLGRVKVTILDSDGNEEEVVSDLIGDELTDYLSKNDGKIRFSIPEGINKQVAVLCADCSIGADGSTNVKAYSYKGITVSSNALILFFENKPLFYGVVGGGAAAAVGAPSVMLFRRRKLIRLKKKVK